MATSSDQQTRDVPALTMRAEFVPSSVDAEKRTVEMTWTTGARVLRGWWDKFWEELSLDPKHVRMDRLNNGAPLLAAHNSYELGAVLGVVESARLEGKKGTATVRFAKAEDDPEAEKVFRKIRDGILQNVSVGYRIYRLEKVEDGEDKIPVMRATDWEPYEISVVPMGADDGAGFRSASGGTKHPTNPCVVTATRQESTNMAEPTTPAAPAAQPSARADAVQESIDSAVEARRAASENQAEVVRTATEAAQKAERERAVQIRGLVKMAKLGDDLADKLIRDGARIEDVRAAVLQQLASNDEAQAAGLRNHTSILGGEDRRDKFLRGAAASIIERIGFSDAIEQAKKSRVGKYLADTTTDPGEFRGVRLADLARMALEMRGVSTRTLHGEALVKRALEFRGDAGMNTVADFAVLLESVVNKVFLGRYAAIPVTWPMWCAKKSVQDFRTTTFYRPGTFGRLDAVTEAGEITHKNIPDGSKATLTPATKGNIIGISRKAIVNDDLGAFRDLAAGLGEAAALTIEYDAWTLITAASGLGGNAPDGVALFNGAHSNIGSTGAMSVATLDSLRAKMGLQKDGSGNQYIGARPSMLLVPIELTGTAKVFNESSADPTDSKNSGVANRVKGLFPGGIIDSPWLSAQSATRHYAVADPNVLPVFAVGFIDGQEAPRIDSEQSFNYDGMQMRVILDYGTAILDYRGAATCAGA